MLKYAAVTDNLKGVLLKIMRDQDFHDFVLVGGTALGLHIGHRKSVDLDFTTVFNGADIKLDELSEVLRSNYLFTETHRISADSRRGYVFIMFDNFDELASF